MGFEEPSIHRVIGIVADCSDADKGDHPWASIYFAQKGVSGEPAELGIHFEPGSRLPQRLKAGILAGTVDVTNMGDRRAVALLALGWTRNAESQQFEREPLPGEPDNPTWAKTAEEALRRDLGL